MKRTFRLLIGLLALLLTPALTYAQAGLLSTTTLNGAIDSSQTTLVLTSAAASAGSTFGAPAANQCLLIDLELMTIRSMSSTTATVTRGTRNRSPHANSAVILTGPCAEFHTNDPPSLIGNQTCNNYVLPWVNVITGDSWWCEYSTGVLAAGLTANSWSVTNLVTRNGTAGSRRVSPR